MSLIDGKIKLIRETQTFDSGFCKREVVITTQEQYPQDIALEFFKDKCDILDNYKVGDFVEIGFNIRGSEYKEKYYVSLNAWKMEKIEGENAPDVPMAAAEGEGDDDLPF